MTFLESKNKSIVKSFDEKMAVRPKENTKNYNIFRNLTMDYEIEV